MARVMSGSSSGTAPVSKRSASRRKTEGSPGQAPDMAGLTLHDLFSPDELTPVDSQAAQAAAHALAGPVASVQLPPDDAMAVRVVPLATIQHLEHLNADAALFQNLAYLFNGAFFSWTTSIVVASNPPTLAWAAGAGLGCLAAAFIVLAVRGSRRAAALREHVLGKETP